MHHIPFKNADTLETLTSQFWFCKCTPPWMFPPLDIPFEYWIEHFTFRLLYVMFRFFTKISTSEFQALQLIVLAAFVAMN